MVSLLLLSHSPKIVEGARDLALEMAGGTNIITVGGTKSGALGADFDRSFEAMQKAAEQGEVIVLVDIGSTHMTAQMAKEALDEALQERVFLSDAALVEGALVAAVSISGSGDAKSVIAEIEEFVLPK
ncbi:MAG: PTS-dependent dihydroxyacetone kinase phosphotransferase subunit DhaM [Spirochaetaceae bacterium]|jgi:dihydroxyacetone kinase phosphotransfer subunit|nr:PTS-dependent dihydroxyacetone kinase phosphotransferase subunit DhaM [Spirochaetaceae bacterium]